MIRADERARLRGNDEADLAKRRNDDETRWLDRQPENIYYNRAREQKRLIAHQKANTWSVRQMARSDAVEATAGS